MKIGRMRHKVTFQYYTTTSDGAGGFSQSWVNDVTCFAMVEPLSEEETFRFGQEADNYAYRMIVRFDIPLNRTLDKQYRIVHNDQIFNIKRIRNLRFDKRFYEIYVAEK